MIRTTLKNVENWKLQYFTVYTYSKFGVCQNISIAEGLFFFVYFGMKRKLSGEGSADIA